jgi:hypothetical protein
MDMKWAHGGTNMYDAEVWKKDEDPVVAQL